MPRPITVGIKYMTPDEFAEYKRRKTREYRQRKQAEKVAAQPPLIRYKKWSPAGSVNLKGMTPDEKRAYQRAAWKRLQQRKMARIDPTFTGVELKECVICLTTEKLVMDHCHERNVFRGVICTRCNTALGMMEDQPALLEQAAKYLRDRGHT